MTIECRREADVIDAIVSRRWPERIDQELHSHVATCPICGDLVEVASALHGEQDAAMAETATLPTSDLVWLRAQARARAEAVREAARPIAVMQALGLAFATAVVSGAIGFIAYWVWTRTEWFGALPPLALFPLDAMGFAVRGTLLAIGLWLILAPVAVYLVATDD